MLPQSPRRICAGRKFLFAVTAPSQAKGPLEVVRSRGVAGIYGAGGLRAAPRMCLQIGETHKITD